MILDMKEGDKVLYKSNYLKKTCKGKILQLNKNANMAYILNPELPLCEICNISNIVAKVIIVN